MSSFIPLVIGSVLVLALYLWQKRKTSTSTLTSDVPLVVCEKSSQYKEALEAQYAKSPNQVYIFRTRYRDTYVVPNHFMKEYAWLGETKASTAGDVWDRLLGEYTFVGSLEADKAGDRIHAAVNYIKGSLSKNINWLLPDVYRQIDHVIEKELGGHDGPHWPKVRDFTSEICLHVYEVAYVGLEMARNETWLENCVKYPSVVIKGALAILEYHWCLRPLVAPFLPELRELRKHRQHTADMLRPMHMARIEAMKNPDFKGPPDLIQSFIKNGGPESANTLRLAETIAGINMAGILTTARVLYQTLLDLATYREYIEPLREEIAQVTAEQGTRDLNQAGLALLKKMDSFIKESQKFHYNNLLSAGRKVWQPITLPDGTYVPANSFIAVPGIAQAARDENGQPRKFDGFHWAKQRETAENPYRWNYVTSTSTDLEFGGGIHACPGRFFAAHVLKTSLTRLLMDWDFWLPDGTSRPEDEYNEGLEIETDADATLFFRRRG